MNHAAGSARTDRLLDMARQITEFFRSYPACEAAPAIADHMRQFWTPAMREKILARTAMHEPIDDPLLVAALDILRR